jgi:hypothetical protein
MKKQRKQYAPEEKVAILRRHLLEKEPISKLCDEVALQPTVFYRLTFMMLDADIVAVSPTSVWRVLGQAGCNRSGAASCRRRARALSSRWQFINTGISTCRTSTSAGPSTTCAAFWTDAVATS